MNSASPTTTASTNRGGRPKEWTEPRARRLVRLYVYTKLPFDLILKLLEDELWKPGKDAANKVKNQLLGNDPRWIRPKDDDDEKRRITALRNSRRGTKPHQNASASRASCNIFGSRYPDDDSLTLAQSNQHSFEGTYAAVIPKQEALDSGIDIRADIPPIGDYDAHHFSSWIDNDMNTSRQGTGLTNSTDTSMSNSFREKLTTVSRDQAKGAWRVLKQFTFPKDPDLQRGTSFSPVFSPGAQLQTTPKDIQIAEGSATHGSFSAHYTLPGDFLNTDSFAKRGTCEAEYSPHNTETCWCCVAGSLMPAPTRWPIDITHFTTHNIGSSEIYRRIDDFGNTAFHYLAATSRDRVSFVNLISQALRFSNLPVHHMNTAGQTFLHVLHQSWFDDDFLLDQLLNLLKDARFDILATDVYGRSFFHLLQNKKQDLARIPAHLFDWNLLKRRDAFGVKPMESRARHLEPHTTQAIRRTGQMSARSPTKPGFSPALLEIPSGHGDESRIRPQAELLQIVVDAIKVDSVNSTQPNPRSEDSRGRNALHCLAEVELDVHRVEDPIQDNQRQKKRKYKEEDGELSPMNSSSVRRLEYLEGILFAGVDVDHYDMQGQTPLMAFIRYRPEDSKFDKESMERVVRRLRDAGANLEKRNREGETALHVAARSGKKVALKELLQLGANPYARDACGLSVLAAIDELWANTERDGALTARLEACRGIFTSLVPCEAQEPTVLQEWGARRPTIASLQ
ncbi:ankyrin [Hypoxylon trugodes]|uniref:ankyrin n=1 Tax=Hypoxylon trugodes TaxID=326681 RepID=UPI0021958301|nr:ankyrin [Hypoxylon trugodes]KAI1388626.1 ankyrin [Hypoxylon trugodes]